MDAERHVRHIGCTKTAETTHKTFHVARGAGRWARLGSLFVDRGRSLRQHQVEERTAYAVAALCCAGGSSTAFFVCFFPVRPMPLEFRGIGTCHCAGFSVQQRKLDDTTMGRLKGADESLLGGGSVA